MNRKAVLVLLGMLAVDAAAGATRESQVDTLFAQYTQPGNPGAAVGIYESGHVVLAKGYGLADLESGIPITARTPFHVASVSKQFTAFAIALLAREGKLDLDADVHQYLAGLPDFGYRITVRQLVQHTSGLRDQWSLFQLAGKDMRDVLSQEQVVNMMQHQKRLNFVPGTRYSYSNTGYTLLAQIVHAVSGKTLRELTTERIFAPLGMTRTFFYDDVREIVPGRAHSYERAKGGQWVRSLLNYQTVGATGLFTTVEDLASWTGNFGHPSVGDPGLIQLASRSGTLNDGTSVHYGFGLSDQPQEGRKALSHSGGDASFVTLLVMYPQYDFGIAVLANREMDVYEKVHAIANIYLPPVATAAAPADPAVLAHPDAKLLTALTGTYLDPIHPALSIERRDAALFARTGSDEAKALVFRNDGTFDLGSHSRSYFRPVLTSDGTVAAVDDIPANGLPSDRYERVTRTTHSAQALAAYTGDYRSDELDVTYSLTTEDGQLVARTLWGAQPIHLLQITADHFDTDRDAPDAFTFVHNTRGEITGALIQAYHAYNTELRRVRPTTH